MSIKLPSQTIVVPQYSVWTRKWFDRYLGWNFKRHFQHIYCRGLSALHPVNGPLLLVANHVSWWDGFFLFEIQRRVRPQAKLFTVALEETYRKNSVLRKLGVLPLQPGSAASVKTLLATLQRLRFELPPQNLVVNFFPQGKITPSFRSELNFQRGLEAVLASLAPITVVPVGIHIEPMTGKLPTAILTLGAPLLCQDETPSVSKLESEVKNLLQEVHGLLEQNGEGLPAPFESWH